MVKKHIELTEKAQQIIRDLQTLPEWACLAIANGMDQANQIALSNIQRKHLTGVGPFPPSEHRLGVVTNRLRSAAWASPAKVSGDTVESAIGDNVGYAWIHEFGDVIHHGPRQGQVRLRTDRQGNLMRQAANAHLAVFARKTHKQAKAVEYQAKAYDVHMPERAPFRTGIEETMETYGKIVSRSLVNAWKGR